MEASLYEIRCSAGSQRRTSIMYLETWPNLGILCHKLSHLLGPPPPRPCRTLWTTPYCFYGGKFRRISKFCDNSVVENNPAFAYTIIIFIDRTYTTTFTL